MIIIYNKMIIIYIYIHMDLDPPSTHKHAVLAHFSIRFTIFGVFGGSVPVGFQPRCRTQIAAASRRRSNRGAVRRSTQHGIPQ